MAEPQENLIHEILTRGVEQIYPSAEALEKELRSGRRLNVYCGFDPTKPSLHIGHAIQLQELRLWQKAGHHVTFLIGDFTARIGDPTDKTAARQRMTKEEVMTNAASYQEQAAKILDFGGENPVEVRFNGEWLDKMNFPEVIELAAESTVQQLLQRDMFQDRLKQEKPLYTHEMLYPLMQGYDSVAMDIDVEVGGSDQTFNMLVGSDLVRRRLNKQKFVVARKLLEDPTGKKMGKTEGNAVFLTDPAEVMFQAVMKWDDGMIVPGYELCTEVPMAEIETTRQRLAAGANPIEEKKKLALTIVSILRSPEEAQKAQSLYESLAEKKGEAEDIPVIKLAASEGKLNLLDALVAGGWVKSKSLARSLVQQGGVRVNGEKVTDFGFSLADASTVQVGKGSGKAKRIEFEPTEK